MATPDDQQNMVVIEFDNDDSCISTLFTEEEDLYTVRDFDTHREILPRSVTFHGSHHRKAYFPRSSDRRHRIIITGIFQNPMFRGHIRNIEGYFENVFRGSYEKMFYGCTIGDIQANHRPERTIQLNTNSTKYMFFNANPCPHYPDAFAFIRRFDVSMVQNMMGMFSYASHFNQNINTWNVSNVTDMSEMFCGASSFNSPIGNWNTDSVRTMAAMFRDARSFNQPINTNGSRWDVTNVRNMDSMFCGARSFNSPIGNWNTSNVTTMRRMFSEALSFNQPIGNWDVSAVQSMVHMFYGARSFNQNLSRWNISRNTSTMDMFSLENPVLPIEFYPAIPLPIPPSESVLIVPRADEAAGAAAMAAAPAAEVERATRLVASVAALGWPEDAVIPDGPPGMYPDPCIVCLDNYRTMAVSPCTHFVLCSGCTYEVFHDPPIPPPSCPMCQMEITAVKIVPHHQTEREIVLPHLFNTISRLAGNLIFFQRI